MIVYLITNTVNGKKYVGKTVNGLNQRWNQHCYNSDRKPLTALHEAIREYGRASFTRKIIHIGLDEADMFSAEKSAIAFLDTRVPHGYNMTDGGPGSSGFVYTGLQKERHCSSVSSPEYRKVLSIAASNRWSKADAGTKTKHSISVAASWTCPIKRQERTEGIRAGKARAKMAAKRVAQQDTFCHTDPATPNPE